MAFTIYGDESTAVDTTVYGAVFMPNSQIERAEQILAGIKRRHNVATSAELHCRVIFHGDQKDRSPWRELNEIQVHDLVGELVEELRSLPIIYSVGAVHRSEYPKTLPAAEGFPAGEFESKQLTALAFQAATVGLVEGLDRKRVTLRVDPDEGRIRWFGKRTRADSNYRLWAGAHVAEVVPQTVQGEAPRLLEVADLFAYTAGRALSPGPCRAKERFEALYRLFRPRLSVLSYDPEARERGDRPQSLLDGRHASLCGPRAQPLSGFGPGACLWMTGVDGEGRTYPCLLMRLPSGGSAPLLKKKFTFDIRCRPFGSGETQVLPFMVRLPGIPITFVSFLNQFAGSKESPILQLSRGAELRLVFVEDQEKPTGEVPIPNPTPSAWAGLVSLIAALPAYTPDAFSRALASLKESADELWAGA